MKVGTDNRRNLYILIALALVALYAASHYYFGKPVVSANTPVPGATKAAVKKPATANSAKIKKIKRPLVASLDPTLRFDLLKASEDQEYTGGKRNIFQPQLEEIPKPLAD